MAKRSRSMTHAEARLIGETIKWADAYKDWWIVDQCKPLLRAVAAVVKERKGRE